MSTPNRRTSALLFASLLLHAGCGPGAVATQVAKAPEYKPSGATKCSVVASQSQPLIVEWPSTERAKLESRAKKGPVVVRYAGCEMQILDRCQAPGAYAYVATTRKRDLVTMRSSDELYANIPIGAARFEASLERAGELNVSLTIVGRYEAASDVFKPEELTGACDGATHVVTGVTVGAFKFFAGSSGSVRGSVGVAGAGAGGGSATKSDLLQEDGAESDCEKASRADKEPPGECGALLRIEVVKLGEMKKQEAVCPEGTSWDGSACLAKRVVTEVACPEGTKWNGAACIAADGTIATQVPDKRTPDAVRVSFVAADTTDNWSVVDGTGRLYCKLPCSRWIVPNSGLTLKVDTPKRPDASTSVPSAVGGPGEQAQVTARRSFSTFDAAMGIGGLAFAGVGAVLLATNNKGSWSNPGEDKFSPIGPMMVSFDLAFGGLLWAFVGLFEKHGASADVTPITKSAAVLDPNRIGWRF